MKFLDFLSFENGSNNAESDGVHSSVMEALLFTSYGGGRQLAQILITLANPLIYAKDFLQVPLFYPSIKKISTV